MSRASRDACRFQTLVQTIHAEIAFEGLACCRINGGNAPGTGIDAGTAPNAQFVLNMHDSVFGSLGHGAGRAGLDAPGRIAVKAGHEEAGQTRETFSQGRAFRDQLAESYVRE